MSASSPKQQLKSSKMTEDGPAAKGKASPGVDKQQNSTSANGSAGKGGGHEGKPPTPAKSPSAAVAKDGGGHSPTASTAAGSNSQGSPTTNNVLPSENNATKSGSPLNQLLAQGLDVRLANRLVKLFSSTKLTMADLDDRAVEALKEFGNIDGAISVLNEFEDSKLEHVANKSAFLCGLMKTHRQKEKASKKEMANSSSPNAVSKDYSSSSPTAGQSVSGTPHPGPDEAKLKVILDRTGYTLDVTSGQRKYGGPPPDWDASQPPPGHGCEVFVGKIPKEIFEDEIIPLFEDCGRIWDLRLMIDPLNGFNRGYAFITFCTKEDALNAQQMFDGHEVQKGKSLKVNISVPNLRLFVGNIPKSKSREEIFQEFSKLTTGLMEVIVYTSPDDRKKNRGFCFLEYDSHKAASLAKRKLSTGRTKVWSCDILVDWADPQEEPDVETMSKVKVLYVRNLVVDVTEDEIKELFSRHGRVERVKKIKDYAFVHFEDRDQATVALRELDQQEMRGVKISVSLAKPPSDRKKKEEILRNRERRVSTMMQSRAGSIVAGMPQRMLPLPPPPMPPPMAPLPPSGRGGRSRQGSVAGPYGHRPSMAPSSYGAYWAWYNYGPGAAWWFGAGAGDPRAAGPPPPGAYGGPPGWPSGPRGSISSVGGGNQHHYHGGRPPRALWQPNGAAGISAGGSSQKQWRKTSSASSSAANNGTGSGNNGQSGQAGGHGKVSSPKA